MNVRKETVFSIRPIILSDYRGRGYLLENMSLSEESCGKLPDAIMSTLKLARYKTEKVWLSAGALPEFTKRALILFCVRII